jgi:hypothetical protein
MDEKKEAPHGSQPEPSQSLREGVLHQGRLFPSHVAGPEGLSLAKANGHVLVPPGHGHWNEGLLPEKTNQPLKEGTAAKSSLTKATEH